jgi:hypothetical protein
MQFDHLKRHRSGVAYVVSREYSRPIDLRSCSTDRTLSFDVSFVTIADASKLARFFTFFQGYSLWFFCEEKVDPRVGLWKFGS